MKSGVSTPRGLKNIQKKQISSAAAGNNHQSEQEEEVKKKKEARAVKGDKKETLSKKVQMFI